MEVFGLTLNSVVRVPGNYFGNDRTEPYLNVVGHVKYDDQARIKWKKDSKISFENI